MIDNILEINEDDRNFVRKFYNTSGKEITRDVGILKEWMKKQPHLPQNVLDDTFLENILIRNKCRIERTKEAIDSYFSARNAWPDYFQNMDRVLPSTLNMVCLPLIPLTTKRERIYYAKVKSWDNLNDFSFDDVIDLSVALQEIFLRYEYSTGCHLILDCEGASLAILKKLPPAKIYKLIKICTGIYPTSLKGMHYLKLPKFAEKSINIFKPVMPQKLFNRIKLHPNLESLEKIIPRDYLPADIGGNQKSVKELIDDWDIIFQEQRPLLSRAITLKSNEKLRIGKGKFDNEMYGVEGTFKKLNID